MTLRGVLPVFALCVSFVTAAEAQNQAVPPMSTWEEHTAKGFVPYHQLTVGDFPINDRNHPNSGFWIKPFIHPRYQFYLHAGGLYYAYVSEWTIFSGLDKNETSRKSSFHDMKTALPFAQAFLDLNELYARQLAVLQSGDLPRGSGPTPEAAKRDLQGHMHVFLDQKFEQLQAEGSAFAKATDRGQNKKKVRELAAAIRKRLEALPAPIPSPSPTATATPATTPGPPN
jgi:hypothetical protein